MTNLLQKIVDYLNGLGIPTQNVLPEFLIGKTGIILSAIGSSTVKTFVGGSKLQALDILIVTTTLSGAEVSLNSDKVINIANTLVNTQSLDLGDNLEFQEFEYINQNQVDILEKLNAAGQVSFGVTLKLTYIQKG